MSLVVNSATDLLPWVRAELRNARLAYKDLLQAIPQEFRNWCRPELAPGIAKELATRIEKARMERLLAKRRYVNARQTASGETTVDHLRHVLNCTVGG